MESADLLNISNWLKRWTTKQRPIFFWGGEMIWKMVQVQEMWFFFPGFFLLAFFLKKTRLPWENKHKKKGTITEPRKSNACEDAAVCISSILPARTTSRNYSSNPLGSLHAHPLSSRSWRQFFSINPATLLGWLVKSDVISGVHSMNSQSKSIECIGWSYLELYFTTSNFEEFPHFCMVWALPKKSLTVDSLG